MTEPIISDEQMSELAMDAIDSATATPESQQLIKTLAIINYLKATVFILLGTIICKLLKFILLHYEWLLITFSATTLLTTIRSDQAESKEAKSNLDCRPHEWQTALHESRGTHGNAWKQRLSRRVVTDAQTHRYQLRRQKDDRNRIRKRVKEAGW